jgi:hypothetical protein
VSDLFGISVAISGARVVVGATGADPDGVSVGSVYVYDLVKPGSSIPVATLLNPNPSIHDYFGIWVSIDGAAIAVGSPNEDKVMKDKGYAYVFDFLNSGDTDDDGLLDSWEIEMFGDVTSHSALDDADADGRVEILEYAFNTDPWAPDSTPLPEPVNEGGYMTMTIAKRPGVLYTVESASTPNASAFSVASTTVIIDDPTTLKVRDNVTIGSQNSRFLRVKVVAAP